MLLRLNSRLMLGYPRIDWYRSSGRNDSWRISRNTNILLTYITDIMILRCYINNNIIVMKNRRDTHPINDEKSLILMMVKMKMKSSRRGAHSL